MAETLKPCPFCGSDATVEFYDDGGWCVACDESGCANMDNTYSTEAEAIAAWNRRAEPPSSSDPHYDWGKRVDEMLATSLVPNPVAAAFVLGREYADASVEGCADISRQIERLEAMVFEPSTPTQEPVGWTTVRLPTPSEPTRYYLEWDFDAMTWKVASPPVGQERDR